MNHTLDTLGVAIKEARLQADMTQKELAEKLHITPRHLIAIEAGRQKPGYYLLFYLVRTLGIPTDEIFYPEKPHDRKELDNVIAMLHYCDEQELTVKLTLIDY